MPLRKCLFLTSSKMDDRQLEKVGSHIGLKEEDKDNLNHEALSRLEDHESEYLGLEEERDVVADLESLNTKSIMSRRTETGTYVSSRTYVSKLERELGEERIAREKIERELDELRKISSELSEKLNSNK